MPKPPPWLQSLIHELRGDGDIVPDACRTMTQIAAELGLSKVNARHLVNKHLANGAVQKYQFRLMTRKGTRLIPHYGPPGLGKAANGSQRGKRSQGGK